MEKYLVPAEENPRKPSRLYQWKRSLIELNGRLESKYRHDLSALLLQSYSQIGAFPHLYHVNGGGDAAIPCQTHINSSGMASDSTRQFAINKQGISALEFDNKGVYLANDSFSYFGEDERKSEDVSKHVLHNSLGRQLDAVRWNLANQDEVACTSMKTNEVHIFDIGYISSEPVEVLKTRRAVTVHGSDVHKGLTDIAFTSDSRLIASDTNGGVNVWDRRMSALPCLELTSNSRSTLNSIKLSVENQMVFGAGRHGIVYMWDLRGGRAASAFQFHKQICHPPVTSWKLSSMLERIGSLKAQSDIVSKEVHSIDFDPSCPYQLAFHLDDGWSGILDIYNFQVTHVHCPPPAWLNGSSTDLLSLRKPSWLATHSIYVVGSSTDNGIHLLDFYPDPSSPCHVDYSPIEDVERPSRMNSRNKQNRFLPLSEGVTACAAHPLNGTIIAGTQLSSLLVVSQRKYSVED
ncbi:TRANSDUCIN/WD40 REPEAT-LIKE SUPERFAMILY PROTEIN [Salix viminalis]|uniref:TRANSDUCIN/WD40 REPEAT-LIKE SUPERFAMILY PROTEIN n=1 Tax=Salix viminalis TaxID=40686 RepID=A0A9Q0TLT9_SALVM|nr:TRANSDUCIN/WD40 REPEAT-LIKE SUPERFAMILY PROTEIN [Salix viminalis]